MNEWRLLWPEDETRREGEGGGVGGGRAGRPQEATKKHTHFFIRGIEMIGWKLISIRQSPLPFQSHVLAVRLYVCV